MGKLFTIHYQSEFGKIYQDSSRITPIIFIVSSSGINPFIDVENYGKRLGFNIAHRNLHYISMGQGQEKLIEKLIHIASKYGHWVILQNIHLNPKWLPTLDKLITSYSMNAAENFRIFMSLEANENFNADFIPINLLESSIKITCETPDGNQEKNI